MGAGNFAWIMADDRSRLLAETFAACRSAMVLIDSRTLEILYANEAFCQRCGLPPDRIVGHPAHERLRPCGPHAGDLRLLDLALCGTSLHCAMEIPRADSTSVRSEFMIHPLPDVSGDPFVFLAVESVFPLPAPSDSQEARALERREQEIRARVAEMTKLYEVGAAVHSSLDLDSTLRLVLVAVTAGEGYRFNRAFLFLRDPENPEVLTGQMAVGPFSGEEARRIWSEMSAQPKEDTRANLLRRYSEGITPAGSGLAEWVRTVCVRLDPARCPVAGALQSGRARRVIEPSPCDCAICSLYKRFGSTPFAVAPLISRGRAEGCILVDNAITREPIRAEDLQTLELFAEHAAEAISNALLYQRAQSAIRERDRALEDLQANQRRMVETEKMAALGAMAATVVHELRTPLAIIGGYARNLASRAPDEEFRDDLDVIRDEVARLEDVVDRLLYYARPKPPQRKRVRLHTIIEDSLSFLLESAMRRGVEFHFAFDAAPDDLLADPGQLRQVLLNLVTNALDMMPRGGRLEVATWREGENLLTRITDSGPGIPPESMAHIFDAFYTTKPKGAGLGLHVAKTIIERHAGRIWCANRPEGGASFFFSLPVSGGANQEKTK